jgi:hypothetical protein
MRCPRLLALVMVASGACDASYGGFLDSVPVAEPEGNGDGPVEVYLAIDGLSRAAFDRARSQGAFRTFADGDLITPFPGTSDYAWTRILGSTPLPGYELQYFDPARNRLEKQGLAGVAEHLVREGLASTLPCYRRFDFLGDGYLWMAHGYLEPEAALPVTLDEMFSVLATRARRQRVFLGYLLNVDVLGHKGGLERAAAALVEIDRRVQAFKARHPGRFRFTLFGDHGNAHRRARLIDPAALLREAGVAPVQTLGAGPSLEAVPVVHVRVNYVALHTHRAVIAEVAARSSLRSEVDLAVAPLGEATIDGRSAARFGVWRRGEAFVFARTADGAVVIEQPGRWRALGIDLPAPGEGPLAPLRLDDGHAFALTAAGPYPDLFHRVATAFTHPAVRIPADVILSFPDDVASFGFHVPGSGDGVAVDGFHGALGRGATLSVLASEAMTPTPAVRADDLLRLFPALAPDAAP